MNAVFLESCTRKYRWQPFISVHPRFETRVSERFDRDKKSAGTMPPYRRQVLPIKLAFQQTVYFTA